MMVMAFLRQADLRLEAQHLGAILAQAAIHLVLAGQDLLDPIGEGIEHQRMILQILGMEELDLRMARRHLVGDAIDALHQHAGEQEIGEDDDAAIAELHRMLQPRARPAGR